MNRTSRITTIALLALGLAGCASTSTSSSDAAPPAAPAAAAPIVQPTFTDPGDKQCKITYVDNGDGTMSWTATTTVSGELITHASDDQGNINRHDQTVTAGPTTFQGAFQISNTTDIGGVLHVGSHAYGCSVAPGQ